MKLVNQFIMQQFNRTMMKNLHAKQLQRTKNQFNVNSFLKLALVFIVMLTFSNGFSQPYDAPSDIPKFQDFLAHCKLQAPTSSSAASNSALNSGYTHSTWFHVVNTDKILFNQTGDLKRTELRDENNWNLNTENRSLHARIDIVDQTSDNDQVTVLQIHDDANAGSGPNKPLLRIYKHQTKTPINHLWAVYKTDISGTNNSHIDLGADPGGYFNCDIRLVDGNMIIELDGVEKVNVDVSYWTFPSYWKAGVYLQDPGTATAHFDQLFTGNGAPLSTDEIEIKKTRVSPNPYLDKVYIETNSEIKFLELYDLTGKAIFNSTTISEFEHFSGTLTGGIYLLKLLDVKDNSSTIKLVKK